MNGPIRIWLCADFQPVYRCGGWASVRWVDGQVSGFAGGERNTTASRTALAGLAAALRDLPPGDVIVLETTNPDLAEFADVIASLGSRTQVAAPVEDLDLWAPIVAASAGRRLALSQTAPNPNAPTAFAAAWAELARDKAKAKGAFASSIPKPNLAKARGLPRA